MGVVRAAMAGVDGVIHLAARPAPHRGTPYEVFGENTLGTFTPPTSRLRR